MENKGEIILYDPLKEGPSALQVRLYDETVWLTQRQLSALFDIKTPTVNEHIKNIYREGELEESATIRKFLIVQKEQNREVKREVIHYNLDMILSLGYRVNSKKGTQFRIWSTKILKDHLIKGFSLNQKLLKENQQRLLVLQKSVELINEAVNASSLDIDQAKSLLDLIASYTRTFTLLNEYDTNQLTLKKKNKAKFILNYEISKNVIDQLMIDLVSKEEASDLFGNEIESRFKAILGNLYQSLYDKEIYPSVEEKAAHLLYFIIKDHPFSDGNKRIASMLFIYFLKENKFLEKFSGELKINDNTLVALALLVAESNPGEKETVISLITNLLT